jgi:phage terminase Nu1 subunit (DNA packaging protein)
MAKQSTQEILSRLTGLSQQRISQLQRAGVIIGGDDPLISNRKIIHYLGEAAAGRQPLNGQLDRMFEAAALDHAKREEIEIRIAKERGHLIEDTVFMDAVGATFTAVKTRLLSISHRLRSRRPNLSIEDIGAVDDEVQNTLTELSDDQFPRHIRSRLEEGRDRIAAGPKTKNYKATQKNKTNGSS